MAAAALKELSVKTALPVSGPALSGSKLTLRLQAWLGASENALLQSARRARAGDLIEIGIGEFQSRGGSCQRLVADVLKQNRLRAVAADVVDGGRREIQACELLQDRVDALEAMIGDVDVALAIWNRVPRLETAAQRGFGRAGDGDLTAAADTAGRNLHNRFKVRIRDIEIARGIQRHGLRRGPIAANRYITTGVSAACGDLHNRSAATRIGDEQIAGSIHRGTNRRVAVVHRGLGASIDWNFDDLTLVITADKKIALRIDRYPKLA